MQLHSTTEGHTCDWITSRSQCSQADYVTNTPTLSQSPSSRRPWGRSALDPEAPEEATSCSRLCISPLLLPSAVCFCELQESATGHRHLHAHRHRDLHSDQCGVLHHPPHECDPRQWCCGCGKCIQSSITRLFGSIIIKCSFTPLNLLLPDVCRPGIWRNELDYPPRRGSFLLRRTQRLHPGFLQVSDYNWIFFAVTSSLCYHQHHSSPPCSIFLSL